MLYPDGDRGSWLDRRDARGTPWDDVQEDKPMNSIGLSQVETQINLENDL